GPSFGPTMYPSTDVVMLAATIVIRSLLPDRAPSRVGGSVDGAGSELRCLGRERCGGDLREAWPTRSPRLRAAASRTAPRYRRASCNGSAHETRPCRAAPQ